MIEHIWACIGCVDGLVADASELEDQIADDLAVLLHRRFAAADAAATTLRRGRFPVPLTPLMGREAELKEVLGPAPPAGDPPGDDHRFRRQRQ